jgi:hypothetical protein
MVFRRARLTQTRALSGATRLSVRIAGWLPSHGSMHAARRTAHCSVSVASALHRRCRATKRGRASGCSRNVTGTRVSDACQTSCTFLHCSALSGAAATRRRSKEPLFSGVLLVLPVWIEHTTSPLPRECSTTELRQQRQNAAPQTDEWRLSWRGYAIGPLAQQDALGRAGVRICPSCIPPAAHSHRSGARPRARDPGAPCNAQG